MIVAEPLKKLPACLWNPKVDCRLYKEPATGSKPEPDESISHPLILFR
jgi:hypothetical protein